MQNGWTPLHWAKNSEVAKLLVDGKADINARTTEAVQDVSTIHHVYACGALAPYSIRAYLTHLSDIYSDPVVNYLYTGGWGFCIPR